MRKLMEAAGKLDYDKIAKDALGNYQPKTSGLAVDNGWHGPTSPKGKKQTVSNFSFDSEGNASFQGYPVYILSDKSGESYAYFAFAGPKKNINALQKAIKGHNKWLTAEYEQDYEDSRGTIGSVYYDEDQEAGLDFFRADKDDMRYDVEKLEQIPVLNEITPKQLKKVDNFYYQLVAKTEKELAKARKTR